MRAAMTGTPARLHPPRTSMVKALRLPLSAHASTYGQPHPYERPHDDDGPTPSDIAYGCASRASLPVLETEHRWSECPHTPRTCVLEIATNTSGTLLPLMT